MTTAQTQIDEARVEAFLERAAADLAGAMTVAACAIGDRLGLFGALAEGPATSEQLAERTGLNERYVREWALGLVTAAYLEHDARTGLFSLPAEHAPVLADEGGLAFLGGAHQTVRAMLRATDAVERAFRSGGGVPLADYGQDFWDGLERLTGPSFEHQLVQEWIPAVPGLPERLGQGARIADIGCGAGVAAITLARAFPACTVHGIDVYAPNVARADKAAGEAGVSDRVTFEQADAVAGIAGPYDLITFFNVVHDTADPLALLRATRAALAGDGVCLINEGNVHDDVTEDRGPLGTLLYGFSLLHCVPQSLAEDGAAVGTCGLTETALRALAGDAGFSRVTRVAEAPLDAIYALDP